MDEKRKADKNLITWQWMLGPGDLQTAILAIPILAFPPGKCLSKLELFGSKSLNSTSS